LTATLAIIGTGIVGERIIKQALTVSELKIIAIYDENKQRLHEIANKYQLAATETLEELLDLRADWVYIGTPPISHSPIAQQIAARGLHILSEKPLAHDAADGEKMVAAVRKANVKSAMHFPMMYSPEVHAIKHALDGGELGRVLRVELHAYFPQWPRPWQQNPWIATREQGGFIREVFPHYLQLTNYLFGGIEISAHETMYPEDPALCEIGATALAKTVDGIPMIINGLSGMAQKERIDYKVLGTKKTLTIRNWSELWESKTDETEVRINPAIEPENLLQACVNGGYIVSFEEGLKVQRWIDELLK